jgi:hypothetical protein
MVNNTALILWNECCLWKLDDISWGIFELEVKIIVKFLYIISILAFSYLLSSSLKSNCGFLSLALIALWKLNINSLN